ncbi:PAP2 superfamily protein [Paraburkholderia sp. BL6665CI2N2]|uniref:phosphatase PAP2 family protein n=1 Tax=Paraburkholderia sp. BL6665CI2N2 TaxID=1938806 RepID=UPI001064D17A|nr:phosphatase PAP2 family protein [Paraburkholderia sp. BL6665CI2N2]TDY17029.1 PAP2 superfamily protein [Paraburkholderia sp. BL6665CI2N2]
MWNSLSNFGDAAVTLPLAMGCAIWIAVSDRRMAAYWLTSLAVGMAIVGATKILYAGCGIEISEIGFRVVSGHTMLSSAVWTTCIALFLRRAGRSSIGVTLGLAGGAIIGAARVFEEAHTVSEVIAGWAIGSAVALFFVRSLANSHVQLRGTIVAAVSLLLVSGIAYGHNAPFQSLIDQYSPAVCRRFQ